MIDTHCHLDEYDNLDEIINHMKDNVMITSGVDMKTNKFVLEVVKHPTIYGTIGLHPENVNDNYEEELRFIEEHINDEKIVGIGEIGLDYHYTKENIELQKEVFKRQLILAQKCHKMVVIHSRDSILDTYTILKELKFKEKVVLHCYSSSLEMAKRFLEFPIMFGIGGVLTFKNEKKLKEIVKELPLEYLLLETDSPYLTPEPFRGKKNEPYNIYYVACKIAEIKGIKAEEVLKITTENAKRQFDLKPNLW